MKYNLRLLSRGDTPNLSGEMQNIGCDKQGYLHMLDKAKFYILKGDGLRNPGALILKQEALSKGGEAVIHRSCIVGEIAESSFMLMGTKRQLEQIAEKLEKQAFGLKELSAELRECLVNLNLNSWKIPCQPHPLSLGAKTLIMGILNVTPDSFSDGGKYFTPQKAIARGLEMAEQGADILDIGGASSRPGFTRTSPEEELSRIIPVIQGLKAKIKLPVSIDTDNAQVAEMALEAGANIINDVSALSHDPAMAPLGGKHGVPVILMHQGYQKADGIGDICAFFQQAIAKALAGGIKRTSLILDPGLGFGKDTEDNLEILNKMEAFKVLGLPILMAGSNKRFVGDISKSPDMKGRLMGNAGWVAASILKGAALVRVHDVENMAVLRNMADSIKGGHRI